MSGSTTAHDPGPVASADAGGETTDARSTAGRASPALLRPVEAAAFWSGVALPFLYVPLLLAGPETEPQWAAALGLLALHAVALYVGRSHRG